MAISLTGTGGLFTRLGRMVYALNSLNVYMGSSSLAGIKAIGYSEADINAQFLAADQNIIDGLYAAVDNVRTSQTAWEQYLSTLAQDTLIQMANEDTPLPVQDLPHALGLLINQMDSATASVNQPTTSDSITSSAQASGAANHGNGVLVITVLAPNGLTQDYIFNEVATVLCTQDAQSGATARQEVFTVTTPVASTDVLGYDFPLGSGATLALTCVDPTQNIAGGNMLFNSDFQTYVNTANVPDNWAVLVGTAGTDILQGSPGSGAYGTYSLQFVENAGHPLSSVAQTFNLAAGTTSTLLPETVYMVNIWAKKNSSLSAAGTLRISLVDGSSTIINDSQGVANSYTVDCTTLSTSVYESFKGVFRTPAILPAAQKLRVDMSVAMTDSGATVNVCGLAMTPANLLYTQGPQLAIFAGPTNFYVPDQFLVQMSNNYGGKFQVGLDKFLSLRISGSQIPSSVSPTISDTLVA